jgi:hypothetical protein
MSKEWWNNYLRIRSDERDKSTMKINEKIEIIDQLTEQVYALFAKPLDFRRSSQSCGSQNLED